jgi:hypothetical protein
VRQNITGREFRDYMTGFQKSQRSTSEGVPWPTESSAVSLGKKSGPENQPYRIR